MQHDYIFIQYNPNVLPSKDHMSARVHMSGDVDRADRALCGHCGQAAYKHVQPPAKKSKI